MDIDNSPVRFGCIIRQYRKARGLSQPALADALGVSRNTVTNWETDRNKPDIDQLLRLCALLTLPVEELLSTSVSALSSSAERHLVQSFRLLSPAGQHLAGSLIDTLLQEETRERDRALRSGFLLLEAPSTPVAAGPGCAFNDIPPAHFFVRRSGRSQRADAVVRVSGASMEPLYRDGDLLFLQYADTVHDGEDVVCSTADGAVVKRLHEHRLISLNHALPYGQKSEDDHVRIVGRVLGVVAAEDLPDAEERSRLEELMADEIRAFDRARASERRLYV